MIKSYLSYRKVLWCFFLSVWIIFPLVVFLSGETLWPVLYALLIVSFLFFTWSTVDFFRYCNRIRELRSAVEHLSSFEHTLSNPKNEEQALYLELIHKLYELLRENTETLSRTHTEQLEYYTMWLHQIKNPIAAIRLLQQNSDREDPILVQELFKIEQYVEMALQYAKLGDLSSDMLIKEESLFEIVSASVKKYAPLFIYGKISLSMEPFELTVSTDSRWLSFVIEQFLSNAVKYTPGGKIRILLSGDSLEIIDNGIGIRREDLTRVFEKGYTGYNGRLDKRASGIGLYMAKKVAAQLSLALKIESEPGIGTKATITFSEKIRGGYSFDDTAT